MNESSLMLAIFHLKRDSTRRTHFPPLPWPQDDGVDSLIFTPIISPPINANSLSGFSQPCLLLWLTRSCWEHIEHPHPRSLESRTARTQMKARHISDRSPPQPHALPKTLALGPGGSCRAWVTRATCPGGQVLALVLLEGDVTDPPGCGSPGPTFGCSVVLAHTSEDWSKEKKGYPSCQTAGLGSCQCP